MKPDSIDTMVEELQEYSPKRDLWPGVERNLSTPAPNTQSTPRWAIAASVAIALVIGSFTGAGLTQWLQSQQPNYQTAMSTMIAVISEQHRQQIERLQATGNSAQQSINLGGHNQPIEGQQALFQAGLEIQQALEQQPDNAQLLKLWLWVQQKERELASHQSASPQFRSL